MLNQLFLMPHYVFYSRMAVLFGVLSVYLLAITVSLYRKGGPATRMLWFLVLTAVFLGLSGLESFSKALDPLYHPSTRTAHLDSASGLVGGLAIAAFLVNWRRLKKDEKTNTTPPAA